MSIETFYTTQNVKAGQAAKSSGAAVAGNAQAGGALGGSASFFDMFLKNAAQALESSKQIGTTKTAKVSSGNGKPDMEALMEFAKELSAALAGEMPEMDVEVLATNENVEDALEFIDEAGVLDVLALNQQQFDKELFSGDIAINTEELSGENIPSILASLDVGETGEQMIPGLNKFEKMLAKIEKLIQSEAPELTALNITPEQINALQGQIASIKAGEQPKNNETLNALMIGLVKILPPQAKPMMIVAGQSLVMSPKQLDVLQNSDGKILPGNDQGGKANALSAFAPIGDDGKLVFFDSETPGSDAEFEKLLKEFGKTGKENLLSKVNAGAGNNADGAKAQNATPPAHLLQGWPFGNSGSLFAPMDFGSAQYDEMGLSTAGQTGNLTGNSPLTSLVTQSQSAGHAHPATQMVAASIKKAAGSGEAKNIRIQLDPPELGRVEIKMSFNKDKTMKAVLTAEKPETYMMLQRDAQVLERALHESGLDVSAEGSLSFELADDGNFGQDGSHDGSRNQSGAGEDAADGEEEILETTMTWHVDPDTGHMRYNILA